MLSQHLKKIVSSGPIPEENYMEHFRISLLNRVSILLAGFAVFSCAFFLIIGRPDYVSFGLFLFFTAAAILWLQNQKKYFVARILVSIFPIVAIVFVNYFTNKNLGLDYVVVLSGVIPLLFIDNKRFLFFFLTTILISLVLLEYRDVSLLHPNLLSVNPWFLVKALVLCFLFSMIYLLKIELIRQNAKHKNLLKRLNEKNVNLREEKEKTEAANFHLSVLNSTISESESTLIALLESTTDMMVFLDNKKNIRLFNHQAKQWLRQYGQKKISIGDHFSDYFKIYNKEIVEDLNTSQKMACIKRKLAIEQGEEKYWFEIKYHPVIDKRDKRIGTFINIKDITESENEVENLKMLNTLMKSFCHEIAHDLNEPTRNINSFTNLLKEKFEGKADPDTESYLEFISIGSQRMAKMISSLLQYSTIGKHDAPPKKIDLNNSLWKVLKSMETQIKEKKAIIEMDHLPVLLSHGPEIEQIFQNLVSNSLKYSREGIPAEIKVSTEQTEEYISIKFIDNGIGIPKKYHKRIFKLFQKQNPNSKKGTGIGLAICERIMINQGGKILIESEEEKGTAMELVFPIKALVS